MSWNTTVVLAEGLDRSELASAARLKLTRRTTTWDEATSAYADQIAVGDVGSWLVVTDPRNTLLGVLSALSHRGQVILAVFGGTADVYVFEQHIGGSLRRRTVRIEGAVDEGEEVGEQLPQEEIAAREEFEEDRLAALVAVVTGVDPLALDPEPPMTVARRRRALLGLPIG